MCSFIKFYYLFAFFKCLNVNNFMCIFYIEKNLLKSIHSWNDKLFVIFQSIDQFQRSRSKSRGRSSSRGRSKGRRKSPARKSPGRKSPGRPKAVREPLPVVEVKPIKKATPEPVVVKPRTPSPKVTQRVSRADNLAPRTSTPTRQSARIASLVVEKVKFFFY